MMIDKQILKFAKLCEHWAQHNDSHKESFRKWLDFAVENQLNDVSTDMMKAIEMMDKSTEYLLKAKARLESIK
jgi:hypothetical protein